MEPEIVYLHVADQVITEEGTGKMSIIGSFVDIKIPDSDTTVVVPQFTVLVGISNPNGAKNADIKILDPDNEEYTSLSLSGDADNIQLLNLRAIFTVQQFTKKGLYKINVELDGKKLKSNAHHTFTVS